MTVKNYSIKMLIGVVILLGNLVAAYSQAPAPKVNSCEPPAEEILLIVKSVYGLTPSPKNVWIAGEIQGGWGVLRLPKEQLSLHQVIAQLGGVLRTASGSIYIIRQPHESQTKSKLEVDLKEIKQGLAKDVKLKNGDLVFVARGCAGGKLLRPTTTKFMMPKAVPQTTNSPLRPTDKKIVRQNSQVSVSYKV